MILTGYFSVLFWIDLVMAGLEILDQAMLIWGHDFRGSLYDILLFDCLLVWPLYRLFASVSTS